jgi:hypothetical protein
MKKENNEEQGLTIEDNLLIIAFLSLNVVLTYFYKYDPESIFVNILPVLIPMPMIYFWWLRIQKIKLKNNKKKDSK